MFVKLLYFSILLIHYKYTNKYYKKVIFCYTTLTFLYKFFHDINAFLIDIDKP